MTVLIVAALALCGCRRPTQTPPHAVVPEPRSEAKLRQPPGWMWPIRARPRPASPPPTRYPPSHAARYRLTAPE